MKPRFKLTRGIVYAVCAVALLCLAGLLGVTRITTVATLLVLAQLATLSLGIAHIHLLYRCLPQLNEARFWPGLFVTALLMLLGAVAIVVVYVLYFQAGRYAFSACVLPFVVPYLFVWVYRYYLSIPAPEYKKWHYPVGKPMPDIDLLDLSKILVIQFEFTKKLTDTTISNFKAKAPLQMTLGELFLIFLNDYNEQNATGSIQLLNEQKAPLGWHFYHRKGWFGSRHYLDPDLTFQQNNIVENLIIQAERS